MVAGCLLLVCSSELSVYCTFCRFSLLIVGRINNVLWSSSSLVLSDGGLYRSLLSNVGLLNLLLLFLSVFLIRHPPIIINRIKTKNNQDALSIIFKTSSFSFNSDNTLQHSWQSLSEEVCVLFVSITLH